MGDSKSVGMMTRIVSRLELPCSPPCNKEISHRDFLLLAGAAATSAMLSACNPRFTSSATQQNRKIQLVYQDWRTEWFPPMAQQLLDRFYREHPNIRVLYSCPGKLRAKNAFLHGIGNRT